MLLFSVLAGACASGGSGAGEPQPMPGTVLLRPPEVYRELGLLAGPESFPAVASFSTFAGPADSAYVLFSLSLPSSALRFEREENGFAAVYGLDLSLERDSGVERRIERKQVIRVPTYVETTRTDDAVLFQATFTVPAARYTVALRTWDELSGSAFAVRDTLVVPAYRDRRLSDPVLVHRAGGRSDLFSGPDLIPRARHTIPYGGDAQQVYIEGYGLTESDSVRLTVRDTEGLQLQARTVHLARGGDGLRWALIDLSAEELPLGQVRVELAPEGGPAAELPLFVTISDLWMVANFDQVFDILTYIAQRSELDSLRTVTGAERRERWDRFWARRDPVPATSANEFRDEFFDRVRIATTQFGTPSRPGWKTDRGEVFIVLGPPAQILPRYLGRSDISGRPNAVEWIYPDAPGGQLELLFIDEYETGRFELTRSSRAAFRSVAYRVRSAD